MSRFYHVARKSDLNQIMKTGLLPRGETGNAIWADFGHHIHDDCVYLFADKFGAEMYQQDIESQEETECVIIEVLGVFVKEHNLVIDHEEFADQIATAYMDPEDSILSYCEKHHPYLVEEITNILDRAQDGLGGDMSHPNRYSFFNKELEAASHELREMFLSEAKIGVGSASRVMHRGSIPAAALNVDQEISRQSPAQEHKRSIDF